MLNSVNDEKIKIAIADDHEIVRGALSTYIKKHLYSEISILADNGRDLLSKLKHRSVDIVILDIQMPVMDGIETLKELKIRNPNIKVIVLTMFNDEQLMLKLIKLKVNGFILKNGSLTELIKTITEVHRTGFYFDQRISLLMYDKATGRNELENYNTVTYFKPDEIEREILTLICKGKTSNQIGTDMGLSKRSVENKKFNMMHLLKIKNNVGLAIYAIKQGIVKV